jgi:hypothetical protein
MPVTFPLGGEDLPNLGHGHGVLTNQFSGERLTPNGQE